MKKKSKKILFTLTMCLTILFILFTNNIKSQSYDTRIVLENAWDKFDLNSFQIGKTEPIISIRLNESKNKKENEKKLLEYLDKKLSREDKEHYQIEMLNYPKDYLDKMKKNSETYK